MRSQTLRRSFLDYFRKRGHAVVPSSPVIPHDDPTLLFTNAGMNQFKDLFLGTSKRDYTRAATSQKCVRVGGKHNDLENVGHTSRHLTLFEMLGNFSFGDYFKKEAIEFAWEVTTHVFGFDPKKVWVSVYQEDDEAFELWQKHVAKEKIVRFGEKENFWSMGDVGPCGPCSELLFDRGEKYGNAKTPLEDASGERFLEFWNLVFMQFERDVSGAMRPLPKPSIDTGAGLERVVSLQMGIDSVFQTDILHSLILRCSEIAKVPYNPSIGAPFHVVADHIRTLAFAIADGVQPSNTDRGYILRKLLRRAVRYARQIGIDRPFLGELLPTLLETMGGDFPELLLAKTRIEEVLFQEEEAFLRTLKRGGNLLSQVLESSKKTRTISGEDAFLLKDTYGLPFEEISLLAKDAHFSIDYPRFCELEKEAKELSKRGQKKTLQHFDPNFFSSFGESHPTEFVGYAHKKGQGTVVGIVRDGAFVESLQKGEEGILFLHKTPFYAEMGGQVGDTGRLEGAGVLFLVENTTTPFLKLIAHRGTLQEGTIHVGDSLLASIDEKRRQSIQNNHTATHLLHWALAQVLGPHVRQAGSLVEESHFRFDFSHHKALSKEELVEIEGKVNEKIRENRAVSWYEMPYEEAQKHPEIHQFFGEKYGDVVRVVDIDFSKELCGGTHTSSLGTLGFFAITGESSIAAGVRRIEAVTGLGAELFLRKERDSLGTIAKQLQTSPSLATEKMEALLRQIDSLQNECKLLRKKELVATSNALLAKKESFHSLFVIREEVDAPLQQLAPLAQELLQKGIDIVAVGAKEDASCHVVVALSSKSVQKGLDAGKIVKEIAPHFEGKGGGKKELAQAGGKNPQGLRRAFHQIETLLHEALS